MDDFLSEHTLKDKSPAMFVSTDGSKRQSIEMELAEIVNSIYLLPESSLLELSQKTRLVSYPKGFPLFKAEKVETNLYFLSKGLVRAYIDSENGPVTFWFGSEGAPVLSMKSYIANEKSYENVELLEDSTFYQIGIADLKSMYSNDIHLANWGRKLAEYELTRTEERLIAMQFKTAQQRYAELLEKQPELLHRVQLGYIASYLGMSQVSLSRIRAELKS